MPTNTNLEQFEEAMGDLERAVVYELNTGAVYRRSAIEELARSRTALRSAAIDLVRSELEGLKKEAQAQHSEHGFAVSDEVWVHTEDIDERLRHYEAIKKEKE